MTCNLFFIIIITILVLLLLKKTHQYQPTYINAGKSSSKTAEVDISYKNGTIPKNLLTMDAAGNMNVLDVQHLESLLEASIERRSREWGEWAKTQAKTYTDGVKSNLETQVTNARSYTDTKYTSAIGHADTKYNAAIAHANTKQASGNYLTDDSWIRLMNDAAGCRSLARDADNNYQPKGPPSFEKAAIILVHGEPVVIELNY